LPRQQGTSFASSIGSGLVDSGLSVVVTGSGGWLGRVTLEMLAATLDRSFDSRVYAFGSRRSELTLPSGVGLTVRPLTDLPSLQIGPHLVAHYAFLTRDKVPELSLSDYLATNEMIRELVAAHVQRSSVAGMFVPSSGAVYRGDRTLHTDLASNPYGVLKRRDEERFLRLAASGQIGRLVCARVFNLAGPGINKREHYVLASIIDEVIRGGPIRLRAARPVFRSYVHVVDLVDLSFAMMLGDGPLPTEPFDTAGEREVEIGDLASEAAALLGAPDMEVLRPSLQSLIPDRYVGDGEVMAALAASGGIALRGLETQIVDTADYLRASER